MRVPSILRRPPKKRRAYFNRGERVYWIFCNSGTGLNDRLAEILPLEYTNG